MEKKKCDQAKVFLIKLFFEEVLKCHKGKSFANLSNILNSIDLPCVTNKQEDFCEPEIEEKIM